MLLAILFTQEEFIAAAALACDQQPYGNRYWNYLHPQTIAAGPDSETAYVEIDDAALVDRLLKMDFVDGIDAARALDAYLDKQARIAPTLRTDNAEQPAPRGSTRRRSVDRRTI